MGGVNFISLSSKWYFGSTFYNIDNRVISKNILFKGKKEKLKNCADKKVFVLINLLYRLCVRTTVEIFH